MGSPLKSARRAAASAVALIAMPMIGGCGIVGGGSPANLDVISVSSPQFRDGDSLPHAYSCQGEGINPPIRWSGTSGAKSVALVVDDNNTSEGGQVHWVVFDINPQTTEIAESNVPRGARQGQTAEGKVGYVPPCKPNHSYRFTIYALDAKLGLPERAPLSTTLESIAAHTMARGRLTAANIE